MPQSSRLQSSVPNASKIAEHLLAHARLCRQIAEQSWNEQTAETLSRLADECTRAATDLDHDLDTARGAQTH
jgi:3-methyladenine DNA glycosylase AlkC